jgi:hypothetical protein
MTARLLIVLLLLRGAVAGAAEVSGSVRIDGRPATNAVVYLDRGPVAPPATPAHAVMDQRTSAT